MRMGRFGLIYNPPVRAQWGFFVSSCVSVCEDRVRAWADRFARSAHSHAARCAEYHYFEPDPVYYLLRSTACLCVHDDL